VQQFEQGFCLVEQAAQRRTVVQPQLDLLGLRVPPAQLQPACGIASQADGRRDVDAACLQILLDEQPDVAQQGTRLQ
jgi:hypothetical protein